GSANRPRSGPDSSTIAGRGGDPGQMAHPYGNIDPHQYDVTPRDVPPGGQEPAGMSSGQPTMTPSMRGADVPTMRTSQPSAEMPTEMVPTRQPAGAAPGQVHEVPAPSTNSEMPPMSSGTPAVQPAHDSPMSDAAAPATPPKGSGPPEAI